MSDAFVNGVAVTVDFDRPWFDAVTAAVYTNRPTLRAWYSWRRRHNVIPNRSGLVAKAALDRVLSQQRPKRRMAAASLANLPNLRRASGE